MFFEYVKAKIGELSELARYGLEELLKAAELLHNQTKAFDKMIKQLAKENEEATRLQTVPGVGPITAMNFIAEIDEPKRFQKSRSVGAYLGMTPTQYSSGETQNRVGFRNVDPKSYGIY